MATSEQVRDGKNEADRSSLPLSDNETKQIDERRPANANIVHEIIRLEGEDNLRRTVPALACSALAAGLAMGFSLVAQGLLQAALPATNWRPLIVSAGYSVGFLLVVLGRQQLFTENTLTPILPLLNRRDRATLWSVARLWGIVLAGNVVGALIFAWVVARTDILHSDVRAALPSLAMPALAGGFATHFLRGIIAGWLIALMIWLLPAAEQARVSVIFLLTYIVGLGAFAHIIAGSVEVFYLIAVGAAPWSAYPLSFFLPTLLGNVIGGVALVAALNYGQVAPTSD